MAVDQKREVMNIVIAGHVDHGKSTIIGRLLADTNSLPEGKLEQIKESCRQNSKPFEYAFLLDALKDEQSQGITIDAARVFFSTKKREYIIIDAPGHIEFLKNMVTGASRAEAALLVIDAEEGVRENSRRHGYMLSMLGIKQVVVLVNKMDLVKYDRGVFNSVVEEYKKFLAGINLAADFVPVSGMEGDTVAELTDKMPWYKGNTVLEVLDTEILTVEPAEFVGQVAPVEVRIGAVLGRLKLGHATVHKGALHLVIFLFFDNDRLVVVEIVGALVVVRVDVLNHHVALGLPG